MIYIWNLCTKTKNKFSWEKTFFLKSNVLMTLIICKKKINLHIFFNKSNNIDLLCRKTKIVAIHNQQSSENIALVISIQKVFYLHKSYTYDTRIWLILKRKSFLGRPEARLLLSLMIHPCVNTAIFVDLSPRLLCGKQHSQIGLYCS